MHGFLIKDDENLINNKQHLLLKTSKMTYVGSCRIRYGMEGKCDYHLIADLNYNRGTRPGDSHLCRLREMSHNMVNARSEKL